jgi:hypothetical protein
MVLQWCCSGSVVWRDLQWCAIAVVFEELVAVVVMVVALVVMVVMVMVLVMVIPERLSPHR